MEFGKRESEIFVFRLISFNRYAHVTMDFVSRSFYEYVDLMSDEYTIILTRDWTNDVNFSTFKILIRKSLLEEIWYIKFSGAGRRRKSTSAEFQDKGQ